MAKSKRNKIVNLTKTKSRGRSGKDALVKRIQDAITPSTNVYVLHFHNMRNQALQRLRQTLKTIDDTPSILFVGSNRVMAKALGTEASDEIRPGLGTVSEALVGEVGLLCSAKSTDDLEKLLSDHRMPDFARGGCVATRTVVIPKGVAIRSVEPVDVADMSDGVDDYLRAFALENEKPENGRVEIIPGNMEPMIRGLGVPTTLKMGQIVLMKDHTVCRKGERLTPQQADVLRHWRLRMAMFDVTILGQWNEEAGAYVKLNDAPTGGDDGDQLEVVEIDMAADDMDDD